MRIFSSLKTDHRNDVDGWRVLYKAFFFLSLQCTWYICGGVWLNLNLIVSCSCFTALHTFSTLNKEKKV